MKRMHNGYLVLLVYDGQSVYLSLYSLKNGKEKIIIDKEPLEDSNHHNNTVVLRQFPEKTAINREQDERAMINDIARIIKRGGGSVC